MAKKKATTPKRPGRGSDQFMVRMPGGMRDTLAKLAANHGRSMNSEIVDALARYVEFAGAAPEDGAPMLTEVGLSQISKRLLAGVAALESMLFEVRADALDAFIADQRKHGVVLTGPEAIRLILRSYLDERGYARNSDKDENPPA